MDKKNKYWQLFLSTFKLSACTFGGGFVIIPLMRERFVKELHWIEEEEMLDLVAIAQSSPGAIAVNGAMWWDTSLGEYRECCCLFWGLLFRQW